MKSNIGINIKNTKSLVYLPIINNIGYNTNKLSINSSLSVLKITNSFLKIGTFDIDDDFLKKVSLSNSLKPSHDLSDKIINNVKLNQNELGQNTYLKSNQSLTKKSYYTTLVKGNLSVSESKDIGIFYENILSNDEVKELCKIYNQKISEIQKSMASLDENEIIKILENLHTELSSKPRKLPSISVKDVLKEATKELQNRRQKISNIGIGMLSGAVDFKKMAFDLFESKNAKDNWKKVGIKIANDITDSLISQTVKGFNSMKEEYLKLLREGPKTKNPNGDSEDDIEKKNKAIDETSNKSIQEVTGKRVKTPRSFLGELMASADFQSNYYNAVIDLSKDNTNTTIKNDEPLEIINKYFLATRLKGIDIPQNTRETFETKFLNTSIKRISPKINVTRTATLTFDEDDNFYISSNFEHLSGIHNWKTFSKNNNNNLASVFNSKYTQIRVIHRLIGSTKYLAGDNSLPHQPTTEPNTIEYVFNDVVFLGKTNNYEFKRGDASQSSVTIKFAFRSVHIDHLAETDNFNPFNNLNKL